MESKRGYNHLLSDPINRESNFVKAIQNVSWRLERIIREGKIRVLTTGDYKPFTYLNPSSCTYEGYDIDVAKLLAKDLGVKAEFISTSWPNLSKDILSGTFDLAVGGITITANRNEIGHMGTGYMSFGKCMLVRAIDKNRFGTLKDIQELSAKVVVNPGGTNEEFVREHIQRDLINIINNNLDIPNLIAEGMYDVMITDNIEAEYYAKRDNRLYVVKPFLTNNEKGYLIPNDDGVFQVYIDMWVEYQKAIGVFEKLRDKWMDYDLISNQK